MESKSRSENMNMTFVIRIREKMRRLIAKTRHANYMSVSQNMEKYIYCVVFITASGRTKSNKNQIKWVIKSRVSDISIHVLDLWLLRISMVTFT